MQTYKNIIRKINALPVFTTLFCILLFYLPFQCRYHKLFKKIQVTFFSLDFDQFLKIDGSFGIYITDILMLIMILQCLRIDSFKTFFWEGSRKFLSLFLVLSLVSVIHSAHGKDLWAYYPYLFQLLIPSLFFFALSYHFKIKESLTVAFSLIFSLSILQCLIATAQYFIQDQMGLLKLGEPALFAAINVPDRTKWILDNLFHTKHFSHIILRATGTLPHPNILGCFIGFSLFVSGYLYLQLQKKRDRIFFSAALFLQWFTLFVTYCRAALIGAALGLSFWFAFFLIKKHPSIKMLLIKTLGCIALCFLLLFPQLTARGGIVNYNAHARVSDEGRLSYQNSALDKLKEHPLLGIGFHQYLVTMKENHEKGDAVHNIYLLIATENGLLGLLAFLCFVSTLIWHTLKRKLDTISITLLSIFLFLLFTGGCHYDLIKAQHGRLMFFISAAWLACYYRFNEDTAAEN